MIAATLCVNVLHDPIEVQGDKVVGTAFTSRSETHLQAWVCIGVQVQESSAITSIWSKFLTLRMTHTNASASRVREEGPRHTVRDLISCCMCIRVYTLGGRH